MRIGNIINNLTQVVTRNHIDLQNVTTSQHHVRYADTEALAAAWANINTKNLNNLIYNGDFELGNPPIEWTLGGAGATLSRSNTQVKIGSYSALLTRIGTDCYIRQNVFQTRLQGRKFTASCWVYATVANRARLRLADGVNPYQYSTYHTGGGTFELLTATMTLSAAATDCICDGIIETGNTSAYFDGFIGVEGDSCPSFMSQLSLGRTKIITFNRDSTIASGDVAYTGVGFKPHKITIISCNQGGAAEWSIGFSDNVITMATIKHIAASVGADLATGAIIVMIDSLGAGQEGIIKSYDDDGFTITWTKFGLPMPTYNLAAICEA